MAEKRPHALYPLILLSALLCSLLISGTTEALYLFKIPEGLIGRTYITETRLKSDGSFLGRSVTRFENRSYKGRDYIVVTASSSGKIDGQDFTSEVSRTFLFAEGAITSYSIKGSANIGGEPGTSYDIRFDWDKMSASVAYNDFEKNERTSKSVAIDRKMIAIQDLDLYLSSLPSQNIREENLKALLPNGQTFGFLIKMTERPEPISVKERSFLCRRVEVKPDLGFISFVIPNVNYWINSEPPHEMIRYSGLLSGPGSPDVVIEAVKSE